MSQRELSGDQRKRLIELLDAGVTLNGIMRDESFRCSYIVLMRWMKDIGRSSDRARKKPPLSREAKAAAIEQMIVLRKQGISVSALTRNPEWPDHTETIRGWLNAAGFIPDPDCQPTEETANTIREMFANGDSFTDIQSAVSSDSPTLSRWLSLLGLNLDIRAVERSLPGGVARLKELRSAGQSVRLIAESHNVSLSIIQKGVDALRLAKPKREREKSSGGEVATAPASKPPQKIGTMVPKPQRNPFDPPVKSLTQRIEERQREQQRNRQFDPVASGYTLRIVKPIPSIGAESFEGIMSVPSHKE